MDDDRHVVSLDEVPADGTLLFTVRGDDGLEEVVLVRANDEVVAYKNYCQHWTDVRLDKGSGALVRSGEIVCQKHAATFETGSGYCNFGPCEGSYLDAVEIDVVDGEVFLTGDGYAFERLGSSGEQTGSSGSRIDFTGT
jgi:nitrite reductase/ring-hydroxylating ferredoxin subunit